MAGKRSASSDLNHDNWDREEVPEEAGTFKRASDDVLKERVIKTARRRNPNSGEPKDNGEQKSSVFSSFTGFGKTPTAPNFNFLANPTKSTESTNGTKKDASTSFSFSKASEPSSAPATSNSGMNTSDNNNSDNYYAKLKGLNESVSKWITKHVNENPLINLQPIFKDYEKFFEELEKEKNNNGKRSEAAQSSVFKPVEPPATSTPMFSFGNKSTTVPNTKTETASTASNLSGTKFMSPSDKFSFGAPPSTPTSSSFTFASSNMKSPTSSSPSTFPFGAPNPSSTPFSFTPSSVSPFTMGAAASTQPPTQNSEEADDDEPPKVEVKEVQEEGHIYTIKCKVYVKKEGTFGDRGVGNLFLKPVPNSEKVQLIVRAHTNLGNLLCNFILSEGIPMQRMGKSNVMLVCIPTPESKPPPVPILLRTKTGEEADALLEILQKHKK